MCRLCCLSEENGVESPEHVCFRNYDGSLKALEADAALHLYIPLFKSSNTCLYLEVFVVDDDSSMRALLKHASTNPKGWLPLEIVESMWLVDPSHCIKVVTKPVYLFTSLSKNYQHLY